jgi:catechol 2,3-dioxygenase-like lactoylglutathione lyase family enzyme
MPAPKPPPPAPEISVFATTVMVSDRKRSVEWYVSKLGFEVVQELGHWVTVGHKGQNGLIHLCQGSVIEDPLEPGVQGVTLHLRGDFERICAALERNGVAFETPVRKMLWGTFARISDPDGNVLNLHPED